MSRSIRLPWVALGAVAVAVASAVAPAVPPAHADVWPAEARAAAINLTSVEGPVPNDFYEDLSGAAWNATTGRLWVVRNGPSAATSKMWVLRRNADGSFEVDTKNGLRGEWTGFGDLEDVTIADERSNLVYVIAEGEEVIRAYDVSVYGTVTLVRQWNTAPYLPLSGDNGAEAITFVPDAHLRAQGFVDRNGALRASQRGMGGLMFVGHQNGGAVFAFDLDPASGAFDFVGEYRTSATETAALSFDRTGGFLYVWHDASFDTLEKCRLRSTAVAGQTYRRLETIRTYDGPDHRNNEGVALFPSDACTAGARSLFMTTDDGGADALYRFAAFQDGCERLTVTKAGAVIELRWTGGPAPYTLRRGTDPGFRNSVVLVNRQSATAYDDGPALDDGKTYFYALE